MSSSLSVHYYNEERMSVYNANSTSILDHSSLYLLSYDSLPARKMRMECKNLDNRKFWNSTAHIYMIVQLAHFQLCNWHKLKNENANQIK